MGVAGQDTTLPGRRSNGDVLQNEVGSADSWTYWSDEELIAALKRRDDAAIAFAVETYVPKLYRYAVYQLGDETAAEDLVSEVVTRMLEKIDGLHYTGVPLQAWLFSIARNLVADNYRRAKRAQVLSLDASPSEEQRGVIDDLAALDTKLEGLADREALVSIMANLTPEQRQVITLRVIEGWQPADIARLLGRTVNSVKSLQYRALQSLKRFWEHDVMGETAAEDSRTQRLKSVTEEAVD